MVKNYFVLDQARALRTTGPEYSKEPFAMSAMHLRVVHVSIENSHDQPIICQLQGKPREGQVWRDIGSPITVAAIAGDPGVTDFLLTDPWDVLRIKYTSGSAPTTGTLLCSATAHVGVV